jgi:lipoprotein-anchoring transpeptidase ErfK/SrfK
MKSLSLLLTAIPVLFFASCRSTPRAAESADDGRLPQQVRPQDIAAVDGFKAKGGKGGFYPAPDALKEPLTAQNSAFIVDLDAQRTYLYQGSRLIAYSPISSGRKYYRTETGTYTIGQKARDHRSTSYGNYVNSRGGTIMGDVKAGFDPMPPGARFEGSLMKWFMRLHYNGGPTPMGFHRGVLPGHPASHGCIRLPGTMAEWFFNNVAMGTPVLVTGKANGIPYGASQNRPKRAPKVHSSLKKKPAAPRPEGTPAPDAGSPAPELPSAPAPAPPAPPAPAEAVAPELPPAN